MHYLEVVIYIQVLCHFLLLHSASSNFTLPPVQEPLDPTYTL